MPGFAKVTAWVANDELPGLPPGNVHANVLGLPVVVLVKVTLCPAQMLLALAVNDGVGGADATPVIFTSSINTLLP